MANLPSVVCLVVAALALWSALNFYGAMSRTGPDPYRVEQQVDRYAEIARQTQPDATLGYAPAEMNDVKAQVLYFGAQYALAPRLLSVQPGPKPVVRNEESGPKLEAR